MSLSVGERLGPYEILAPIGAGGMGEVYRARDTKLDRDVAIKVLPAALAQDPERLARFEREAKVLASLNHPNIAQIYGIEDRALVMELVDGETLRGPLLLETALNYSRQIANALEAAHEKGIIHRDLKPANIMVTPAGVVKVLDFGLAAVAQSSDPSNPATSPTLTISPTRAGMILGTAAYMSPEQARGKPVDKRADIWAFGVVLFEMLTGTQLFHGETVSDTLAQVLTKEPDSEQVPAKVRRLLQACLRKDPKQRLQAIGDWKLMLPEDGFANQHETKPSLHWILPGVAASLALIAGVALSGWLRPAAPGPRMVVRLSATLPVATNIPGPIAVSRDGSRLAFVAGPKGQIFVRMIDQLEATPIPRTEGAGFLCFSPDGTWISYIDMSVQPNKLKKIAIDGGPAQVLADALNTIGPPTQDWGLDDNILFSSNGVLMRIPAAGGTAETLATPDPAKKEIFYLTPQLLPGGKQILFGSALASANPGRGGMIAALNLRTGEKKVLVRNVSANPRYVPTGPGSSAGYIVYYTSQTGSLMAVAFDASRMEVKGSPVAVLDGVQGYSNSPFALMGISDSGTLAYVGGGPGAGLPTPLIWVDRKGVEQPLPAPARTYSSAKLSPDGQRIALMVVGQGLQVWVYDLARGTLHNVTAEGDGAAPIWTKDGKRLIYAPSNGTSLVWAPADGSSAPSMLTGVEKGRMVPTSVSPDGKMVIGFYTSGELWVVPLPDGSSGNAKPQSFLDSRSQKAEPAFSPDGHWVAYRSDETGNREIYVAPYPGPGGKFLISTEGGTSPHWSDDGRELFYRSSDKMMAVDVQTSPEFRAGTPKILFAGTFGNSFDLSSDGKRFLMIKPPAITQRSADQVTVVLNWFDELRRRVPTAK
ncbi:MAG TPA: protein kinase [Bryobacteraceae bacterium]|nr:protein kinase [Bryobacteraceae bacterium]